LAALSLSGHTLAGNWPRFRGPNGTGMAAQQDLPVRWEENNILWKTALPGAGNSSPIVWGERLFLQTASPDGRERALVCVNVSDGRVLWSRSVPGSKAKKHDKNTLASGTPATDGERVYTVFWDGNRLRLAAHDFDGQPLWTRDLGTYTSQHGPGHSPVVHAGKVFVANDQDGVALVQAFDARTGAEAWQAQRKPFRACYSTPFILERPGHGAELVVASTAGLTGYNPETGSEVWNWVWDFGAKPLRTVASPVAANGLVFINSGDGGGDRHTVAVRVDGTGAPQLAWEARKTFSYVPTMLTAGDYLFFVNDLGVAGCCLASTGKMVWTERLGGPVSSSPILVDNKVFVGTEDGEVVVFAAGPEFKTLARNRLGDGIIATPAVADGRLYVRDRTHLYCIGRPNGRASK
jgi:outer membrane protein assembly factor BamB